MKNIVIKEIDKSKLLWLVHEFNNRNYFNNNLSIERQILNEYTPSYFINDVLINEDIILSAIADYYVSNENKLDIKILLEEHQRIINDDNIVEESELQLLVNNYIMKIIK